MTRGGGAGKRCRGSPAERGVTLIEMAASMAALVVIGAATVGVFNSGVNLWKSQAGGVNVQRGAARALVRVADAAAYAELSSLQSELLLPGGSSELFYTSMRTPTESGPPTRILWIPEPGDPEDGLDNDGDGAVDEGLVVRRIDPGTSDERQDVLATGVSALLEGEIDNDEDDNGNGLVDERGICFFLKGHILEMRLTLERSDGNGGSVKETVETSIAIRN
jgi:hypothetical protein